MLATWGLQPADTFLNKEWTQLSGGESQRMVLAIAIASKPCILAFDESTSALDSKAKQAVEQSIVNGLLLQRQAQTTDGGMGILWISHDSQQVDRMTAALQHDIVPQQE